MKEITLEFKAAAFAAYWGSFLRKPIWQHQDNVHEWFTIDGRAIDFNNSKLQLRRLEEISLKDRREVAKIASAWDGAGALDQSDVLDWLGEVMNGNRATFADYVSGLQFSELIDFLRSRYYHLPFRGVDLVKAGIAEYTKCLP